MKQSSIIKDIENNLSTDAIVDKYLNRRLDNYDNILKVIKDYKWQQWRRHGRRV
tara:strand:+ start:4017 stop:4178 length:162 start_codon:yes stop_codon:yes gene_type:complete